MIIFWGQKAGKLFQSQRPYMPKGRDQCNTYWAKARGATYLVTVDLGE